MDWGVVTTVPACEHKAKADLTSVGFSCYFPCYESVEAVRGQIVRRARPLFPGYIFFGPVDFWRKLSDLEHVRGVLMCGKDHPSKLPQEVIDELREREGPDGVIKLDDKRRQRFGSGAKVRVRRGVMVGFSGIVASMSGAERVKVLFEMMGRKTSVTLREADITAA